MLLLILAKNNILKGCSLYYWPDIAVKLLDMHNCDINFRILPDYVHTIFIEMFLQFTMG